MHSHCHHPLLSNKGSTVLSKKAAWTTAQPPDSTPRLRLPLYHLLDWVETSSQNANLVTSLKILHCPQISVQQDDQEPWYFTQSRPCVSYSSLLNPMVHCPSLKSFLKSVLFFCHWTTLNTTSQSVMSLLYVYINTDNTTNFYLCWSSWSDPFLEESSSVP